MFGPPNGHGQNGPPAFCHPPISSRSRDIAGNGGKRLACAHETALCSHPGFRRMYAQRAVSLISSCQWRDTTSGKTLKRDFLKSVRSLRGWDFLRLSPNHVATKKGLTIQPASRDLHVTWSSLIST